VTASAERGRTGAVGGDEDGGDAAVPTAAVRHLYVHVPFCARRCSYCDFAIAVRREVPVAAFLSALAAECDVRGVRGLTVDSLYLGGGTPSRLGGDGVARVLGLLRERVALAVDAEVTLEANPEDVTASAVRAWVDAGVNRVSLGVQSFDDAVLRWMHRVHDAATADRAVHAVRDGGIANLSLDLIFAMPEGHVRSWTADLDHALALAPAHLSLYGLTIEPHTPLGRWHARGEAVEGSESRYEAEFLEAHARLDAAGFEHYEVSNFARPGRRARHNAAYWSGAPYVGVGPSAHGFDGVTRRWNVSAYAAWRRAVADGIDPVGGSERLTMENRTAEAVYLGLRTDAGLRIDAAERQHVSRWIDAGWVRLASDAGGERLCCTATGWLRLDALAADLTALRSRS
jgi:oxygen-independent coproporphyrinogen-3 oxidase